MKKVPRIERKRRSYWQDWVDGTAEYIHYEEFITPLIKAMQELSAKVEALENA